MVANPSAGTAQLGSGSGADAAALAEALQAELADWRLRSADWERRFDEERLRFDTDEDSVDGAPTFELRWAAGGRYTHQALGDRAESSGIARTDPAHLQLAELRLRLVPLAVPNVSHATR